MSLLLHKKFTCLNFGTVYIPIYHPSPLPRRYALASVVCYYWDNSYHRLFVVCRQRSGTENASLLCVTSRLCRLWRMFLAGKKTKKDLIIIRRSWHECGKLSFSTSSMMYFLGPPSMLCVDFSLTPCFLLLYIIFHFICRIIDSGKNPARGRQLAKKQESKQTERRMNERTQSAMVAETAESH